MRLSARLDSGSSNEQPGKPKILAMVARHGFGY